VTRGAMVGGRGAVVGRRGAVVLCGGRSVRMGRPKALLPFGDETLLARVVRILRGVVEDVVVVRHQGQALPPLAEGVRVVEDELDDQGPLAGLVPGLRASRADAVYATGCDVPFLAPAFVECLFASLGAHDIAVAETDGFTHPLAAVYRVGVRPVMERLLDEVSFEAPDLGQSRISIDEKFVRERLETLVEDEDLARFIL